MTRMFAVQSYPGAIAQQVKTFAAQPTATVRRVAPSSQLQQITTADGSRVDSQLSQLVQAMATYGAANPGFDPTLATQAPNDPTLQNTLAAAWHH
jgi:hypothetical protein